MRQTEMTFEGTWEDLQKHAAELAGRRVRLTVIVPGQSAPQHKAKRPRKSSAAALLKHATGWAGDDFGECLQSVYDNRLKAVR